MMVNEIDLRPIETDGPSSLQFFESRVQAGFPSPVQGSYGDSIDLNHELINSPASTFCARVTGNSMLDAGINDGDLIIVDRAIEPHEGCIAVCYVDGGFTVKRLHTTPEGVFMIPANNQFPSQPVGAESNFRIWGVVTHIIKNVEHRPYRTL